MFVKLTRIFTLIIDFHLVPILKHLEFYLHVSYTPLSCLTAGTSFVLLNLSVPRAKRYTKETQI